MFGSFTRTEVDAIYYDIRLLFGPFTRMEVGALIMTEGICLGPSLGQKWMQLIVPMINNHRAKSYQNRLLFCNG